MNGLTGEQLLGFAVAESLIGIDGDGATEDTLDSVLCSPLLGSVLIELTRVDTDVDEVLDNLLAVL